MGSDQRKIWKDGEFVPWSEASVHVLSQSVQRGTLAFDYMSIHETSDGPAIFRLRDHLKRLVKTCEITGLALAFSEPELIEGCIKTTQNNPNSKYLKISALIPSIEAELIPQNPTVSVYIAAYDVTEDIIIPHAESGFKQLQKKEYASLKIERHYGSRREDIIPPHAKVAANYTSALLAKVKARKEGFDDVLLLNEQKLVTEASTSNIFVVNRQGEIITPPANKVLLGITRDSIITLASELQIPCHEKDLDETDLLEATEVFLTATSTGALPVTKIDGTTYGEGLPGPITHQLMELRNSICRGENSRFSHWLHIVN
tara:strand:- start:2175 stop:3122 length:948 start_codon:yes stop_codon:yes gene_type:complete